MSWQSASAKHRGFRHSKEQELDGQPEGRPLPQGKLLRQSLAEEESMHAPTVAAAACPLICGKDAPNASWEFRLDRRLRR